MVEQNAQDPFAGLDLEGLFDAVAKGNFGLDITQPQPQEQSENELLYSGKSPKAPFIIRCISFVLPLYDLKSLQRKHVDIRSVANYFRKESAQWKAANVAVSLSAKRADEAEIIKSLTYEDMAKFAKGRFDVFIKESAAAVPFSDKQKQLQGHTDYWAWVEQVITEADDQEKKNPPLA